MAIRKRKGKPGFQVYWRNPISGKQECRTFNNRKEAEKEDARIKFLIISSPESFRETEDEDDGSAECLEDVDYAYLQEKKFSVKSMSWHLDGMKIPLALYARLPIAKLGKKELARILARHLASGVKPVTVKDRMKVLFILLRWSVRRGFLESMPTLPELPEGRYEHFIPPSPEEAARIYAVAPPHVQRVIVLGTKLGVRVGPSELFKICWRDVDFSRGVLRVWAARKNKAEPWREVPIKSSLIGLFRSWMEADFSSGMGPDSHLINYRGKAVRWNFKTAWENALVRAGISRRIRPYDLRHAFATDAIEAGADIGTVARLMGHSSPAMVLGYYQHVTSAQKKEAVEALPDIGCMSQLYVPKEKGPLPLQ